MILGFFTVLTMMLNLTYKVQSYLKLHNHPMLMA